MLRLIENISKVFGFTIKGAAILGGAFFLMYCAGLGGFFPSGVTVGDTLLFIFFSGAFGFIYGLLFGLLFCMGYALTPIARQIQRAYDYVTVSWLRRPARTVVPTIKKLNASDLPLVLPGLLMLLLVLLLWEKNHDLAFAMTVSAIGIFTFWVLIIQSMPKLISNFIEITNTRTPSQANGMVKYKKQIIWAIFALIPIFGANKTLSVVLDAAARVIGLRAENISVQIPKERIPVVRYQLNQVQASTDALEILPNDGGAVLKNVDIPFQGIGTKTLILIRGNEKETSFSLPSQDVVPLNAIVNKTKKQGPV